MFGCDVNFTHSSVWSFHADVMQISPTDNNGTHGSMNHVLRRPHYTPAPTAEQSVPVQCPLISLDPADDLGCSCPALVGIVTLRVEWTSHCKARNLCMCVLHVSWEPFIQSTSNLMGVLLGTEGRAVLKLVRFGQVTRSIINWINKQQHSVQLQGSADWNLGYTPKRTRTRTAADSTDA